MRREEIHWLGQFKMKINTMTWTRIDCGCAGWDLPVLGHNFLGKDSSSNRHIKVYVGPFGFIQRWTESESDQ